MILAKARIIEIVEASFLKLRTLMAIMHGHGLKLGFG